MQRAVMPRTRDRGCQSEGGYRALINSRCAAGSCGPPMRPRPRLFPAAAGVPATALLTSNLLGSTGVWGAEVASALPSLIVSYRRCQPFWDSRGQWANGDFWGGVLH